MNWKKLLKTSAQLIIYLLVGWFIYSKLNGDLQSVLGYDVRSYPILIASVLICAPLSFVNALNWHRMMHLTGQTKLSRLGQIDVYLHSFLLRYIPGNVVGILSRATLNKKHKVSMIHSLWGWFLENIVYLLWGIVLGSYIVIKNITEVSGFISGNSGKDIAMASIAVFLIFFALLLGVISIIKLDFLEGIFKKFLMPKIPNSQKSSYKSFHMSRKSRLEMLLRYLIAWIFPSISFLLVVYGLTGVIPEKPFELISAHALAWAIGYIVIITPSGGGVREVVLIQLLSMLAGFSVQDSIIITLTSRIVSILGELLTLGIFYTVYFLKNGRNKR